ncbi:ParM/StbA family protein [Variovorax gossypii]
MSRTILSIDVGFGNTKAVWSDPGAKDFGPAGEICFSSVVPACHVPALEKAGGLGGGALNRVVVEVDGRHFFVGPEATLGDGARILDPNFIERPEYRALIAGALHYFMRATGHVSQSVDALVLGLPVSAFATKRAALKAVGGRVHRVPVPKALQGRTGRDTIDLVAKKVIVVPQPYGGLRFALNEALSHQAGDLFVGDDEVNLVIDPGFNTFDWFVAQGMEPQLEISGSFPGGVSQIVREVAHAAGMSLGVGDLNFVTTERALASGVLTHGGQRIDFTPYRTVALSAAQRVVDEFLLAFNFEGIGVNRVILAGGGAMHYLQPLRDRLPGFDVQVQADSVMSNARGYWLVANDALAAQPA